MNDHNQFNKPDQSERAMNSLNEEEVRLSEERSRELEKQYIEDSLPFGFSFDADEWLIYQEAGNPMGPQPLPTKVCSRLEVAARTRDQFNENHGRLLRFFDPDGILHQWAMPMEQLAGDGSALRQELFGKGLLIAPGMKARQSLIMYIQTAMPSKTVRCTQQTGWNHECTAFVLYDETIGNNGKEALILQMPIIPSVHQFVSGTLLDWQQIASLCLGNSKLIFAVSLAFATPLLKLLDVESGGFLFRGQSSSGKSTCLRAANSVWGAPELIQQMRATANGLEGIASAFNDGLLCLDELGQVDPEDIGKAIYMLANGVGKARADKLGNSRKRASWRIIFLMSGELKLSDCMREAKQKTRAGQELRILDIPADNETYGCFQCLHGYPNGKQFADKISELSKKYYGIAGREFLKHLLPSQERVLSDLGNLMDEVTRVHLPLGASGQVHRAFNRFALAGAAGEVASSFGITGWEQNVAMDAAMRCFNDWLSSRGDIGSQEVREILSHVRRFFEQHGESRFSPWHHDDSNLRGKTISRAGFRKMMENGEEFFMFREAFKEELCSGFDERFVARLCLEHGWLMPDTDNSITRPERLPGIGNVRVYRFTSYVLRDE